MPNPPDYYTEQPLDYPKNEVREIQRKQLIKEGKALLRNKFTKNGRVSLKLQECILFMEQE